MRPVPRSLSDEPVVVLADDDPFVRTLFSRALKNGGYRVRTAMDIMQAMTRLSEGPVFAAIVDMLFVNSAGLSGLDLLRWIRVQDRLKEIPVLLVTGFALNKTVTAEVEKWRGELWHKPLHLHALLQRLNTLRDPPMPN